MDRVSFYHYYKLFFVVFFFKQKAEYDVLISDWSSDVCSSDLLGSSYASLREAHDKLRAEIRNREKAEEALRQSQKMEAMGQLTGGVAHDFNNLLMVAQSGLDLMDRTSDPAKIEKLKAGIRHAIDRGAKLTQQLLTFARKSPLHPEVVDIGRRLRSMDTDRKSTRLNSSH